MKPFHICNPGVASIAYVDPGGILRRAHLWMRGWRPHPLGRLWQKGVPAATFDVVTRRELLTYDRNYNAWKNSQVCIGCGVGHADAGTSWMTEYICMRCHGEGVRGKPAVMFDGDTGHTYRTTSHHQGNKS